MSLEKEWHASPDIKTCIIRPYGPSHTFNNKVNDNNQIILIIVNIAIIII